MEISNLITAIDILLSDPKIMKIYLEIFFNPGINAKNLIKQTGMKRSILYNKINILEEERVIESVILEKKNKRKKYFEKEFQINKNYLSIHSMDKNELFQSHPKEISLFFLFNTLVYIYKQIELVKILPEKQIYENLLSLKNSIALSFIIDELKDLARLKMNKTMEEIMNLQSEMKNELNNIRKEAIDSKDNIYYFGLLNMKLGKK